MVVELIKCTKGIYWRDQGFSACEDIPSGNKFRLSDGTEVQNTSSSITRGFKAGYNIIETKGEAGELWWWSWWNTVRIWTRRWKRLVEWVEEWSGGGGSGYTDGSVTIVSTQQGGSTGAAKVVIRLAS